LQGTIIFGFCAVGRSRAGKLKRYSLGLTEPITDLLVTI